MRDAGRCGVVVLVAMLCAAVAMAEAPVAVSPGDSDQLAQVEVRCPTFNWGAVTGAKAYQLVVYRLGEEASGENAEPVVRAAVPGSATGWTPAMDQCLERGGRYAWTVRAVSEKQSSEWSRPALFQVAAPTAEQFQEALEVVRSYLASQDGVGSGTGEAAQAKPAREADSESPARHGAPRPRAAAPAALSVEQGVEAASFKGDGSELTALDPGNLLAGTADIDVSGSAANVTGTVLVEHGGTGATTVSGARSNLGAAASGANNDITGLFGLASPLSVAQGGTAATSATAARASLGAAADADLTGHAATPGAHHTRYADAEAVSAMGAVDDGNPLHHNRYTDAEVVAAVGAIDACGGFLVAGRRWLDRGDGTVLDCNTGKIWLKDATCLGQGTWDDIEPYAAGSVQAAVANLNDPGGTDPDCRDYVHATFTDWRVPEISELCSAGAVEQVCPSANAPTSLLDSTIPVAPGLPRVANGEGTGRWTPGNPFFNVTTADFWSATAETAGNAWVGGLQDGDVIAVDTGSPTYVWPVREGQ